MRGHVQQRLFMKTCFMLKELLEMSQVLKYIPSKE